VSDSVTSTGFLFTTEYSAKSLHFHNNLPAILSSQSPSSIPAWQPSRALRSSTQQLLRIPYMSTDFGRCAFSYSSPATWNSIPISIRNCSSLLWPPFNRRALYFCPVISISIFFFSSPNLSGRRLVVYHTLTHGVALVRI